MGNAGRDILIGLSRLVTIPIAVLVVLFLGALASAEPTRQSPETTASAPSTAPALPSQAPESTAPLLSAQAASGNSVQVVRVIDGDTLVVTLSGREEKVRVLGIDSCEMSTPAGPEAKLAAESWLPATVTLIAERPAPHDRDQYGRLLRYVKIPNGDLGELMVTGDHTGVYAGRNDASPAYVAKLRSLDLGGRNCAGAPTTKYVPLAGGGDDDDRKSRFCRRHAWC